MADTSKEAIDLVEFIAKAIVEDSEAVRVTQRDDSDTLELGDVRN